jgi:acetyltransferase-like isoleucine patch superfamily enzyme
MSDDFLSAGELAGLGLRTFGRDVSISRHALILRPDRLVLGDRVRIDAFSIVSAPDDGIEIGSDVHLSAHAVILGRARTVIGQFCAVSVRVTILTSSDDFSGASLVGAGIPDTFRACRTAPVVIHDHVIIGAGSVVLPGVTIHAGAAVGALSLVTATVPELTIVAGVPARTIKPRHPGHRALARELRGLRDAERDR